MFVLHDFFYPLQVKWLAPDIW